jgi:hypothetical protein
MGKLELLFDFLHGVDKRWGRRGIVLLVVGAVVGVALALSTSWYGLYQFAKWEVREDLASANKRADRAVESSADANKRASDAQTALQEQKAKYEEELSSVNAQLQALKKNAALQKQTVARRPKSQILTDLFGDDEYFIIGHHYRRLVMDRRYTILATPGVLIDTGGLLGRSTIADGCTLTVTNVYTNEDDKFEFVAGKSGVLSVGEAKVPLILMSATSNGSRSDVCVFQLRQ